jgi:hypothetical protein
MLRGLLPRLFSATLILLIGSGGGGLPVVDGLFFHGRDRAAEASLPHYEATAGCHSDGCAIRSTAHHARFTAAIGVIGPVIPAPQVRLAELFVTTPRADSPQGQPLSRAPPLFG